MMGLEAYAAEARRAGIVDRLKAEKFEEIRDAARDVIKAEKALKAASGTHVDLRTPEARESFAKARKDLEDYNFVLYRFIQRAAEGDL